MNKQIIVDIKINKDNNNLCDWECPHLEGYGHKCTLFDESLKYEIKRCRKCMLREIMFTRKLK